MDKIEKWTPQVGDTFRLKGSEKPQKIEDVIYEKHARKPTNFSRGMNCACLKTFFKITELFESS